MNIWVTFHNDDFIKGSFISNIMDVMVYHIDEKTWRDNY